MTKIQEAVKTVTEDFNNKFNKGVEFEVNEKGGVKITNVRAIGEGVANEWYSGLINLLKSQKYADGLDRTSYMIDIEPFKDVKEWENGQIQIISKDLLIPEDGYSKVLEFDAIYNPIDRTIAVTYGEDTFKKSVREKMDVIIAQRAINDQGAVQFLTNLQDKQNDDLTKQLYDDFIEFFKTTVTSFYAFEIDSSALDTVGRNELIVQNEKDAVDVLKRPNTIYNETGFVYSERAETLALVRDALINNSIEVTLNANRYNTDYLKTEAVKIAEMLLEPETTGIYSVVSDVRKVVWNTTIYQSGSQNLDIYQMAYASRLWYGFYSVPWLGGIAIIEAAGIDPEPEVTEEVK